MVEDHVCELFLHNITANNTSPAYAALMTIAQLIKTSNQTTARGLSDELKQAQAALLRKAMEISRTSGHTLLSVRAATDMVLSHISRSLSMAVDFESMRDEVQKRASELASGQERSLTRIAQEAKRIFKDNMTLLVHGFSRAVFTALEKAAATCRLKVVVTECRPYSEGYEVCKKMKELNIPARVILDSAVACTMGEIDAVIMGAEAIVESGGIINRVGTFGISIIAKQFQKPVYVLAECLKFMRIYPLSQSDMPDETYACYEPLPGGEEYKEHSMALCDLTPPALITLLFTDLGILTPSAISDHLIQLYNG